MKETAHIIAAAQGLQARPLKGLIDLCFREWEGLPTAEVQTPYPDLWRT